jgi:hypothetical protein
MVVVLAITICSKAIFLKIVLMPRNSVAGNNVLDMLGAELFLVDGTRATGRRGVGICHWEVYSNNSDRMMILVKVKVSQRSIDQESMER